MGRWNTKVESRKATGARRTSTVRGTIIGLLRPDAETLIQQNVTELIVRHQKGGTSRTGHTISSGSHRNTKRAMRISGDWRHSHLTKSCQKISSRATDVSSASKSKGSARCMGESNSSTRSCSTLRMTTTSRKCGRTSANSRMTLMTWRSNQTACGCGWRVSRDGGRAASIASIATRTRSSMAASASWCRGRWVCFAVIAFGVTAIVTENVNTNSNEDLFAEHMLWWWQWVLSGLKTMTRGGGNVLTEIPET